jgi:hypothetical protein
MNELLIDESTGEIIPTHVMVQTETVPSIIIDVKEVDKNFNEPMKLVEMINKQAGFCVFDIKTKKGQDDCRSHAAKIIRCIAPVIKRYKELEEDAQKIVNQGRNSRKVFEAGVREIAEYHRKPLTEWEEEQSRIAEQERLFAEKMEAMRLYLIDWDDAISFNELFDLRREKAKRDAEIEALQKLKEQEEYDRKLQEQAVERERARIREEEQEKAEAEQAKKLEAALKEQHAEAMERIAEENRIERERIESERQEKIRLEQHQRDIDIELHESKSFCDSQISTIKKDIEESEMSEVMMSVEEANEAIKKRGKQASEAKNKELIRTAGLIIDTIIAEEEKIGNFAEPVTISRTEYLKLKGDSAQLWKIIELWHQAKRMSECAERADSSSARNKELVEARKVRQQAIDIIENR